MILVSGGSGQVGRWIAELGGSRVLGLSSAELDVTNAAAVDEALITLKPDWVINCAAHTAVDAAEIETERAESVNVAGARNLARSSRATSARMVHISTDYVFGETFGETLPLTEERYCAPQSEYGKTKLNGEKAVRKEHPAATIVRTSWVYSGPARVRLGLPGNDFVSTMISLGATSDAVHVVDDQVGSPTFAHDLAAGLLQIVNTGVGSGKTLHAAGAGQASWCDLARAVFEEVGADPSRVKPCRTEDFPRPAPRPAFSVLSSDRWRAAGLTPLRDWREALAASM